MSAFNWLLDFVPVLSVVVGWVRKLFNVKVIAFLALKAVLFFLCYKYFPYLFGKFYQWIADLGASSSTGIDLSYLNSLIKPQFTGLLGWLFVTSKLDVCFRILIAGATVRLGLKRLPFMPG
ncbi:MAG: hypothetical protein ACTFAK_11110 [Candidatus Electronema sp. VV]